MRLMYPIFSDPILFEENKVNLLVLESGAHMAKFILELQAQIQGKNDTFILSKNYEPINIRKNMELITDFFSININAKKILTRAIQELCVHAVNENNYIKSAEFKKAIMSYMEELAKDVDYNISYDNTVDLSQIFKALKIEIQEVGDGLLENLLEYLAIITKFFNIKCFTLINLKSFLSQDELSLFYQEVFYRKYHILLIESHMQKIVYPCEKIRIFDNDLCEIKINN